MFLNDWKTPLAYVGLTSLAYISLQFIRQAKTYLLPSTLTKRYNRPGNNWALVTGATDGIGFGFCQELCARGFNVILHGRNRAKLERRVRELAAEFPARKTRIVVLDAVGLTAAMDGVADEVQSILRVHGGQLSVLVNNVGGDTRPYTTLAENRFEEVQATIDTNVVFMMQITRVLLPLLMQAASGLVLNVSSIAAYGMPYISVYSSSKGFTDTFTRALEAECAVEGRGVNVMGLRVGQVKTAGFDYVKENLFVPTGRGLASAGLNRVGCGQVIVWAYFWHWVQGVSFDFLPRWMLMKITVQAMRSLKKAEEKAKKS